ncbi:MAG: ComF family protein [Clostridia bacterium]|nr:ComF family protein [Clostridia bacterium]
MKEKTIMHCKRLNIDYRNNFIVTYPPRRKSGKIKYGYDHTKLLAKAYAKKMGMKVVSCFTNIGRSEQKTLTKHERVINAANSYRINDVDIQGKNVFLIDDVITSGATVKVCMQLLKTAGAKMIIPVTYAKDTK